MARIRSIKPGFFKDSRLYDAEILSGLPLRVAFAGLWTVADREGRFKWLPREIKTDVLPYDNVDMSIVMDALADHGFVFQYKCNGYEYGLIPKFLEHQHVNKNEAPSTIPEPPKNRTKTVTAPSKNINLPSNDGSFTASVPDQHHELLTSCVLTAGVREGEENNKPQAAVVVVSQKPLKPELPIWIPADAWAGFCEMRRKKRAVLTDRAIRGIIGKLEKLRAAGNDPGAVLDQSTMNAWQDVFELREIKPDGKTKNRLGFVDLPAPDPAAEYYASIADEPP